MSDATLRLFVAVYPPPATAETLLALAKRVAFEQSIEAPRYTPVNQVHVTLQFIGNTRPRDVDTIVESVECAASGVEPTSVQPERFIALPNPRRARIIAVETDASAVLRELKSRLVARLARRPSRRGSEGFRPHLTLSRFRGERELGLLPDALGLEPFRVADIKLMRSRLDSAGARHDIVATVPLG